MTPWHQECAALAALVEQLGYDEVQELVDQARRMLAQRNRVLKGPPQLLFSRAERPRGWYRNAIFLKREALSGRRGVVCWRGISWGSDGPVLDRPLRTPADIDVVLQQVVASIPWLTERQPHGLSVSHQDSDIYVSGAFRRIRIFCATQELDGAAQKHLAALTVRYADALVL